MDVPDPTNMILIDDKGREWDAHAPELRAHFESALEADALCAYLITNLGWIEIIEGRQRILISCRPRHVSEIALAKLAYFLADRAGTRIRVDVLGEDWASHDLRNLDQVMLLLGAMRHDIADDRSALVSKTIKPGHSPLFERIFQVLSEIDGERHATLDDLDDSLTHKIANQRWTVSHFEDGRLVTDRLGNGFTPFNTDWSARKQQAHLNDYADKGYADWVTEMRKRVFESNVAIFDEVDAVVRFPKVGTCRLLYSQATASLTFGRSNRRYVISAAESLSASGRN